MKFKELEVQMRKYEESKVISNLLPDVYLVARLDGKGFTNWTRKMNFDKPFDQKFSEFMEKTVRYLMNLEFKVIYGYTQSDEISLLIDANSLPFNGKERKLNSILAGYASAYFSNLTGEICVFDCRMIVLPNKEKVIDYFQWRQEDATRNALNGYAYWTLRKQGMDGTKASKALLEQTVAFKNELLFQNGINFNETPLWQRRGTGFYWNVFIKEGYNPITQQKVTAVRRKIVTNKELPCREEYSNLLNELTSL